MRAIFTSMAAALAGVATFAGQPAAAALQAPASPSATAPATNPGGPGWRQAMLSRGQTLSVDSALANLTRNLALTSAQSARIRPILQAHHDRIQNILETAPATLTHEQFMTQVHQISAETHEQINGLLTPHQRALVNQLKTPARM